jgi:antitoxin VapB
MTFASPPDVAKVFMSGRSQAVRLPKAFRFETNEVTIERVGDAVILRPKDDASAVWATRLVAAVQAFADTPLPERDADWHQSDREGLAP